MKIHQYQVTNLSTGALIQNFDHTPASTVFDFPIYTTEEYLEKMNQEADQEELIKYALLQKILETLSQEALEKSVRFKIELISEATMGDHFSFLAICKNFVANAVQTIGLSSKFTEASQKDLCFYVGRAIVLH